MSISRLVKKALKSHIAHKREGIRYLRWIRKQPKDDTTKAVLTGILGVVGGYFAGRPTSSSLPQTPEPPPSPKPPLVPRLPVDLALKWADKVMLDAEESDLRDVIAIAIADAWAGDIPSLDAEPEASAPQPSAESAAKPDAQM